VTRQRRALVTGVSGGIGRATAVAFVTDGWSVIGLDRTPPPPEIADAIVYAACDLGDSADITATLARLIGDEPLDALVNNAAIQLNKALSETSDDEWDLVMNTNVRSAFLCMRETHTALVAARGAVVNVSSVHAVATSANVGAYAASKGALVNLTRELAAQWARSGVRVNALAPGWFLSEMTDGAMFGDERGERWIASRTPMGRGGRDDELDGALLFLASGASSFVTGQVLCVDGGWTIV